MQQKFYNLSNDYLFKSVFRSLELLKQMVLDIFDFDLSNFYFDNPRIQSKNKGLSNGEYDLLLTSGKEYVILEMQNSKYGNFVNRSEVYKSSIISNEWKKQDRKYENVKFVKLFWLLNYKYHNQELLNYQTLETRSYEKFGDDNEIRIFNIKNRHKSDRLKKYQLLFECKSKEEIEYLLYDKELGKIVKKMLEYNESREIYQEMVRSEIMHWTHEDDLKLMRRVAHTEGEKVGEKRGERRGEKRGIMIGKIETANRLLSAGVPLDVIIAATNLSKKQIKNHHKNKIAL